MALFAISMFIWVLVEEEIATLFRQRYELAQVVWWRYATHLVLLLVFFGRGRPQRLWTTRRLPLQMLRSSCMVVMPFSFIFALRSGAPADAVWSLFWVAPLLVLLIAQRWLTEAPPGPSARVWWLCICCTVAAAFMLWPQVRPFQWPPLGIWPMASATMAISFATYVVATRALREEGVLTNLFFTAIGPFALLTPFMPGIWVVPTLHDAIVFVSIGALGFVALWALDRGCAAVPLSLTAPALYVYLPILAVIEWAVQGNTHVRREMLSAAIICLVLAYLWRRAPRPAVAG